MEPDIPDWLLLVLGLAHVIIFGATMYQHGKNRAYEEMLDHQISLMEQEP
jgi:hypothetical protein